MRQISVAMCLLAVGCASPMVQSFAPGDLPNAKDMEFVAEYGLAASHIRVTISAAGGASGGAAKPEAGVAAKPEGGTVVNNTITIGSPEPKPATKPAQKEEKPAASLAAACGELRTSYNSARGAAVQSYQRHSEVIAFLQSLPTQSQDIAKKDRDTAIKRLEAFVAQRASDAAMIASARLNFDKINGDCPLALSVKIEEVVLMDQSSTYRLYASRPVMADNNITLELDGGYIKSINASSEDRSGDIVVAAAKLVGTFQGLGKPGVLKAIPSGVSPQERVRIALQNLRRRWDTGTLGNMRTAVEDARTDIDKALPAVDADLPFQRTYALSEFDRPIPLPEPIAVTFTLTCSGANPQDMTAGKGLSGPSSLTFPVDGILVSGVRPCTIVAKRSEADVAAQFSFAAADPTRAVVLPVPHQAFVKDTSNYTIAGGRLTKVEIIRPSPIASFASVPGRAIGGFIEGIVGGIKGPKDVVDAETARIEADTKRIEAAQKLQKLQKDEDAAGAEDEN